MDDLLTECAECGSHAQISDSNEVWYCAECENDLNETEVIEYCKPCCSGH